MYKFCFSTTILIFLLNKPKEKFHTDAKTILTFFSWDNLSWNGQFYHKFCSIYHLVPILLLLVPLDQKSTPEEEIMHLKWKSIYLGNKTDKQVLNGSKSYREE